MKSDWLVNCPAYVEHTDKSELFYEPYGTHAEDSRGSLFYKVTHAFQPSSPCQSYQSYSPLSKFY